MPTPPDTPPRSFASLRQLQARTPQAVRKLHRSLDEIADLPEHMTRRGVVTSFLVGLSGLTLACKGSASDSPGGGGSAESGTPTDTGDTGDTGAPEATQTHAIGAWLNIATDDTVTITVVKNEMGQGIATGMAMVVAEELDADWDHVRMTLGAEMNDTDLPGWSDGTWGSTSMSDNFTALRQIGAAAREMLVAAAAAFWDVDASTLSTHSSTVSHPDHGTLRYGELAEAASLQEVPGSPALKDAADFSIVGQEQGRLDIDAHTRGQTVYGIDVVVDDMLYAAVRQSPVFGGEVANLDALSIEGTAATAIVPIPNGIAVVAESWWVAKTVLGGLDVQFVTPVEMDGLSTEGMAARFAADLDGASTVGVSAGDVTAALAGAKTVLTAEFGAQMLAHAPMEPMSCTADVRSDSCEIWVSTQYAKGVREAARSLTGLSSDAITVHPMALGGGFGRKAETDYTIQAVTLSQAIGRPVKVIWTREEDIQHDYYRPPAQARITAGLDGSGTVVAWKAEAAGTSYFGATSSWNLTGFYDFPYAIDSQRIAWAGAEVGVPFGYLRAPGHNKFNFMVETFMDELAEAAGMDPIDFRLRHLDSEPRVAAAIERVAEISGWGSPSAEGAQHGCSVMLWGTDSIIAQVAEVSISDKGLVTVHHVWAVIDVGRVINPDLVRSQIEGSVVYGLSSGLLGEITLRDGAVEQSNFHDYPVLRMDRAPTVTTEIIESDDEPGGVGELAVGGAISAVLNAMARVDGVRVRSLPITRHGYS